MKFFKIILVFILHVYRPGICFGADAQIDSLKKLLFTSEKEMHVNYLNMISKAYIYQQRDSCMLYASRAFNEAKNLNYAQGMGDALFSMGKTQSNFSTREKYFLQAIPYYQASHNTDTLGQVYFQLG